MKRCGSRVCLDVVSATRANLGGNLCFSLAGRAIHRLDPMLLIPLARPVKFDTCCTSTMIDSSRRNSVH
jgi:hypothetical protein